LVPFLRKEDLVVRRKDARHAPEIEKPLIDLYQCGFMQLATGCAHQLEDAHAGPVFPWAAHVG
jgi:hypothetical protein